MSKKISLYCMSGEMFVVTAGEGIQRALLFEKVNDIGEYHHHYFIHSSSLSRSIYMYIYIFNKVLHSCVKYAGDS